MLALMTSAECAATFLRWWQGLASPTSEKELLAVTQEPHRLAHRHRPWPAPHSSICIGANSADAVTTSKVTK
jgi:hypothetical protein